jgi:hypothetical protein
MNAAAAVYCRLYLQKQHVSAALHYSSMKSWQQHHPCCGQTATISKEAAAAAAVGGW